MAGVKAGVGGEAYAGFGVMGPHRRCRTDTEGEATRALRVGSGGLVPQQRGGVNSRTPAGRLLGQL